MQTLRNPGDAFRRPGPSDKLPGHRATRSPDGRYSFMSTRVISRRVELAAVADFLASAASGPSALVMEGEAGIGKSTVWLAALDRARELGFAVLSMRAASVEPVPAYTALAVLLDTLDDSAFAELPPPQRLAIERVLFRAGADDQVTDPRAIGAAFVSIVERLAMSSPVLVAIDDLQWVDQPSRLILSSVMRRLSGPVGVLATVRDEPDHADAAGWVELRHPERLRRERVRPLSVGALHAVLSDRLHTSFSRPNIVRIHELSAGNPFYGIELGRAMDGSWSEDTALPIGLAELIHARLATVPPDGRDALLVAASVASPTLDLIARATGTGHDQIVALLERAEDVGIIQIDGHQVGFTHPLLRRGASLNATQVRRCSMHRRLAEIIDEPELKARHLALAAVRGDELTLRSLDAAADLARIRGAPIAAAELLDLAIGLGGDTPERRIRSAAHHNDAGDPARARDLLNETMDRIAPGALRAEAMLLLAAIKMYDDSFVEAAALLEQALEQSADDESLQVRILVMLAYTLINGGRPEPALQHVDQAVVIASRLGQDELVGQALGMRATLRFIVGEGFDEDEISRAVELANNPIDLPLAGRPAVQNALLLAWTGQLDDAARELAALRERCVDRGGESELIFLNFHSSLLQIWRGNLAEAELVAEETMELALQLNGDMPLFIALTIKAMNDAYAGRVDEARCAASDALAAAERCGSRRLSEWSITSLGFLETSLGNYEGALRTLAPLLTACDGMPNSTEIITASFIPDAAEAMIALGQVDDAEKIVAAVERNGARLDRAWMLAVSARCRAMLLVAGGDIEAAYRAVETAMAHHDRVPMPFERARTQLLMGQLQRRQRQRDAALATLREALATFEALGTPLWAGRARAEVNRATGRRARSDLTASEQRVAELAATGLTNREMATSLFMSPKTVEATLSRIYRKLSIRSRAELGRLMSRGDE